MKFKPMFDKVLVKLNDSSDEEKTAGGLYIPSSAKSRPNQGTVVSVGEGKCFTDGRLQKMSIKVGDKVLIPEFSGLEVELPDGKFYLFSQEEILGTFQEEQDLF